jgi:hypothetical protein
MKYKIFISLALLLLICGCTNDTNQTIENSASKYTITIPGATNKWQHVSEWSAYYGVLSFKYNNKDIRLNSFLIVEE